MPPSARVVGKAVSPGLTLRPSLSALRTAGGQEPQIVSPGLTLRPSLSVHVLDGHVLLEEGVAGVHAPAFVEPYRVSMATENWALVGTEGCSHGLGRQGPDARFRRATPEPMEWTGPFLMLH